MRVPCDWPCDVLDTAGWGMCFKRTGRQDASLCLFGSSQRFKACTQSRLECDQSAQVTSSGCAQHQAQDPGTMRFCGTSACTFLVPRQCFQISWCQHMGRGGGPLEDAPGKAGKDEAHGACIEEEPGELVQQGLKGWFRSCVVEADIQHLIRRAPACRELHQIQVAMN